MLPANMQYFNKHVPFIDAFVRFHALEKKHFFINSFERSKKTKIGFETIVVGIRGSRRFCNDHVKRKIICKIGNETTNC